MCTSATTKKYHLFGLGRLSRLFDLVQERRHLWQRQRNLAAPLTLGQPVRLIGDVIGRAVQEARGEREVGEAVILGHPASAGRATGPVRIVQVRKTSASSATAMSLSQKRPPRPGRLCSPEQPPSSPTAAPSPRTPPWSPANTPSPPSSPPATPPSAYTPGQRVTVDGTAGTVTPHTNTSPISGEGQAGGFTARMIATGTSNRGTPHRPLQDQHAPRPFKITFGTRCSSTVVTPLPWAAGRPQPGRGTGSRWSRSTPPPFAGDHRCSAERGHQRRPVPPRPAGEPHVGQRPAARS